MPFQTPLTTNGPQMGGYRMPVRWHVLGGLFGASLFFLGFQILTAGEGTAKPASTTASESSIVRFENTRLIFIDRYEVAFDRPGVLQFVVEEGETVTKGQVVARQEDSIARAAVSVGEARVMNTAEIQSAKLQAELAQLKFEINRQKAEDFKRKKAEDRKTVTSSPESPLTAPTPEIESPPKIENPIDDLYPKVFLDELRLTVESARAEIGRFEKEHEVNQKGLLQARAELEVLQLKAPQNGLVTRAFKQTGEGTQSGEKVLEIISTQRIRAEVDVPAVDAARLKVGIPITVIVQQPTGEKAMSTERYPATLKFIDPTIGQLSHKVRIWAELDNSHGKLREGLTASMEIVPGAVPPATTPQ